MATTNLTRPFTNLMCNVCNSPLIQFSSEPISSIFSGTNFAQFPQEVVLLVAPHVILHHYEVDIFEFDKDKVPSKTDIWCSLFTSKEHYTFSKCMLHLLLGELHIIPKCGKNLTKKYQIIDAIRQDSFITNESTVTQRNMYTKAMASVLFQGANKTTSSYKIVRKTNELWGKLVAEKKAMKKVPPSQMHTKCQ